MEKTLKMTSGKGVEKYSEKNVPRARFWIILGAFGVSLCDPSAPEMIPLAPEMTPLGRLWGALVLAWSVPRPRGGPAP